MNSVCGPHIILIFIAYHLFVLCLLVCFLLACSTSALQCNCKKAFIGIHESYFIFVSSWENLDQSSKVVVLWSYGTVCPFFSLSFMLRWTPLIFCIYILLKDPYRWTLIKK
jgi:hypothetical protein